MYTRQKGGETVTRAQEIISSYIDTIFAPGEVEKTFSPDGITVTITKRQGGSIELVANLYGDIMRATTREIIAEANTAHNLDALYAEQLPTAWKTIHPQGIIPAI